MSINGGLVGAGDEATGGLWIIWAAGKDDPRSHDPVTHKTFSFSELANVTAHLRKVPLMFTSQSVTEDELWVDAHFLLRSDMVERCGLSWVAASSLLQRHIAAEIFKSFFFSALGPTSQVPCSSRVKVGTNWDRFWYQTFILLQRHHWKTDTLGCLSLSLHCHCCTCSQGQSKCNGSVF